MVAQNVDQATLFIRDRRHHRNLVSASDALGRLTDVEQFQDIIIKSARAETAEIVRIRDVTRVELSRQSYSNFAELRGHKSANIIIFSLPGANALDVAGEVRQAVAEMSKQFPPGLIYDIRYDTTKVCAADD
jgi:hydrophobic/amphiphilic exporter-1 (mainly G- bacteria), HAE1 family